MEIKVRAAGDYRWLFIVALTGLLVACATHYPVSVDYDNQYPFAELGSYALIEPDGIKTTRDDLLKGRVKEAIQQQMEAKGWQSVAQGSASIWISFFVTNQSKQDVRTYQTYNSYYGYSRCYLCAHTMTPLLATDTYVVDYAEKTLVIDFVDPQTNTLKWRGKTRTRIAQQAEDNLSVTERIERVNAAVAAILSRFPPPQENVVKTDQL